MAVLLDTGTEFGVRAARRLREEMTAWLTSMDRAGTPQPAPVWFLWRAADSSVLVYSQPGARRLSRIRANPHSSLHLNDTGEGHDFVVLTGTIEQAPGMPPAHEHTVYAEKYAGWMDRVFGSAVRFCSIFERAAAVPRHQNPGRLESRDMRAPAHRRPGLVMPETLAGNSSSRRERVYQLG